MALYLFDLDGTLITSYMDNRDRDYHRWQVLPGRAEKLQQLLAGGDTVGIATNQAGVGLKFVHRSDFDKKIRQVLAQLGLGSGTPVSVCFAHPDASDPSLRTPEALGRRKPGGGMLRELAASWPVQAAAGSFYVGDRPEDRAAAQAAGFSFVWAEDFFGRAEQ